MNFGTNQKPVVNNTNLHHLLLFRTILLEPLERGSPVWQTDRQTDGQNCDSNSAV